MSLSGDQEAELVALREANSLLSDQVKRLFRTEGALYQFQEQLDAQFRLYRQLYEAGQTLNATFSMPEILATTARFVVYNLGYERCAVLLRSESLSEFAVEAWDGYYGDCESAIRGASVSFEHLALRILFDTGEPVVCVADGQWPDTQAEIVRQFRLDEAIVFRLGVDEQGPCGLIIAGNTKAMVAHCTRVKAEADLIVGLANLASQSAAAIKNSIAYRQLDNERRLLEQKVRERTRDLEEANEGLRIVDRMKSQFFANISHELRTPLTLSVGPLEQILLGSSLGSDVRSTLQVVYRNQLRLLKLINELLEFSKLEAGKMTAKFRPIDVVAAIRFYLSTLEAAAKVRGIQLEAVLPDHPVTLYVDPDKFEKIVMNLLSNAFKFTQKQGRITARLQEVDETVIISISDTGIGIPANRIASIFDRFSQADGSDTRQYEGTGIGLALVSEYMALHLGSVGVQSEPARGSTFTLTFQQGKDHLPADALDGESVPAEQHSVKAYNVVEFATQAEAKPDPEPDLDDLLPNPSSPPVGSIPPPEILPSVSPDEPPCTILVADDSPDMRTYMASLLRPYYRVHTAVDGAAALELAQRLRPDLLISDVMMPRMSGTELCSRLKNDESDLRHMPVILVTAKVERKMRIEGLVQGADDYLSKPFDASELLCRVKNLISLRRYGRRMEQLFRNLETKDQVMDADLAQAEWFQRTFLAAPPASDFLESAVTYRPMSRVGGDLYDICHLQPDRFRVFLADAVGHGVQAALRTMVIKSEYDRLKTRCGSPADVLQALNDSISARCGEMGVQFTACCVDLTCTPAGTILCYANAAHPPVLWVGEGGVAELYEKGPFLGVIPEVRIQNKEYSFGKEGALLAYTDGLLEQNDGKPGLPPSKIAEAFLADGSGRLQSAADNVVSTLESALAPEGPSDDVTVVVVARKRHVGSSSQGAVHD